MYRVVLFSLLVLVVSGFFINKPINYGVSILIIVLFSFLFHKIFIRLFKSIPNHESWLITALILICLLDPISNIKDLLPVLIAVFVSVAGKYIFAYKKVHIFNPVALGSLSIMLLGYGNATWWIASRPLLPIIFILGFLVARKLKRQTMVFCFLIVASVFAYFQQIPMPILWLSGPLVFFACIMFTEPLTTPPTKFSQLLYATFVGIWFTKYFNLGPMYGGPEFALLLGNLMAFMLWKRQRVLLKLIKKTTIATNTYNFEFSADQKFNFIPGQFLEWTIPHTKIDSRGNRRWFSISSSPTEENILLGTKIISENGSSLKTKLTNLQIGDSIEAHQSQGDFVLPKDTKTKLTLIAGGIGITPFRSMVKYNLDKKENRDITLLYANNDETFAYKDIFDQIKTIYYNTGKSGYITANFIQKNIPDFAHRHFYISGPPVMVDSYKKILSTLKVKNIHVDYFPGC